MNDTPDTPTLIAMLAVVTIMVTMIVGLAFGMSRKRVPWFFAGAFAILAVIMFREHWAAGAFTAIIGVGGVAAVIGIDRSIERDKAAKKAVAAEPKP